MHFLLILPASLQPNCNLKNSSSFSSCMKFEISYSTRKPLSKCPSTANVYILRQLPSTCPVVQLFHDAGCFDEKTSLRGHQIIKIKLTSIKWSTSLWRLRLIKSVTKNKPPDRHLNYAASISNHASRFPIIWDLQFRRLVAGWLVSGNWLESFIFYFCRKATLANSSRFCFYLNIFLLPFEAQILSVSQKEMFDLTCC